MGIETHHPAESSSVREVSHIRRKAYKPSAPILDYATTKGAIVAFTKGLAQELIEQRGIRVNCVAPGPVWTPLIPQSFSGEKLENFGKQSPTKRAAQPAELAPSYVFLASEDASYINGNEMNKFLLYRKRDIKNAVAIT